MKRISCKHIARTAVAAGLGISLTLSAAPVAAYADDAPGEVAAAPSNDTGSEVVSENAISFSGKTYSTLSEAFAAAKDGGTIKLLGSVTVTGTTDADARGLTGDVVLDLNGNTVYGANNNIAIRALSSEGGSLTITNGSIVAQQGTYCTVGASAAELYLKDVSLSNVTAYGMSVKSFEGGYIKLENCTSTSTAGGTFAAAGGTIDVVSGTYTQTGYYDHNSSIFGSSNGTGLINVYGGTFTSDNYGIYIFSSGGTVNFYDGALTVSGDKPAVKGDIDANTYPGATGQINIAGGEITGAINNIADAINVNISGGTFSTQPDEKYLAEGATYNDSTDKVEISSSEEQNVQVVNPTGQLYGVYESLEAAIEDAPAGTTVKLLQDVAPTSTIAIDKAITLTAADGVEITALTNGQHTFALSNGATLDGLDITINDVNAATNIVNMTDGTAVKNCMFTGSYDLASNDNQVCRAVEGSSGELTIEGNTFTNLRQPGYINTCTGTIANNTIKGTRGWVICGDSNMEITGNTFEGNAVDIAIIDSNENDDAFTNNYAKKADDISSSNNGAYVQNQLGKVEAKNGVIVVGASADGTYTLDAALAEAEAGATILLEDSITVDPFSISADVTIDGDGNSITNASEAAGGTFITISGAGATIKDAVIDAGAANHGVQFYNVKDGALDNVTVNGGAYTSVLVNGSGVAITDCTLSPGEGAYANVEYAMGQDVTTVPSVTFEGTLALGEAEHDIWADQDTVGRVKDTLGDGATNATALDTIVQRIDNNTRSDIELSVRFEKDGEVSNVTVAGEKPVTPPAQTGDEVKVEQAEGGKVTVAPSRADEGDEVVITATPDAGQEVKSVTVTDADGKAVKVTKGDEENTWTFEMPDGGEAVKVEFGCDGGELCPTHGFGDVPADAWYHEAVDWAVEEGLLSGYADGKLGPDGTLSRAQLATVLWRQAGEPAASEPADFADCDPDAFYADAVAWAASEGIVRGYGDGTNFGPEDPVTREQLATILWRQAGEPEGAGDLSACPDGDDATAYAVNALEWAVDEGVLSGFGTSELAPGGVLSRAMLAAMLQRISA